MVISIWYGDLVLELFIDLNIDMLYVLLWILLEYYIL